MVNQVFLDEHGLVHILVVGDQTAASIREMGDKLRFYLHDLQTQGRPVLVLDNLLRLGRTTSEARAEVAHLAKTLHYDRLAMVGGAAPVMRYGTNLMLRGIGQPNTRYFASLDAARDWLLAP